MEIRYLEEFIVLADCLNFSEAASRLLMAQSTLSKHIRSLEQEMGGQLLRRSTRQISLSDLGELYLPYARKMVEIYRESDQLLREFLNRSASSFTLAAVHNLQYFNIDRYIIGFHKAFPECTINVVEGEESELRSMFLNKQANIFTAYVFDGDMPDYDFIPIAENHIVAVVPQDHRLAGDEAVSLAELQYEKLLVPNRNSRMFRAIKAAFNTEGISPRIVYEGNSIGSIDLVKSGLGISLQPKEFVTWRPDQDVRFLDIMPLISYRYGLGYRNDRSLSAPERKLITYLSQISADFEAKSMAQEPE